MKGQAAGDPRTARSWPLKHTVPSPAGVPSVFGAVRAMGEKVTAKQFVVSTRSQTTPP